MENVPDKQLRFVQNNRDSRVNRRFPVPIGTVAAEWLNSGSMTGPTWRRQLSTVLSEYAGPLMEVASIVGVRKGELKLHVYEPALMYSLRMTWEQHLLNVLQAELPAAGIHVVRFTTGTNPSK